MTNYQKVRVVAESVLQPGEALKHYAMGSPPQGCLAVLAILALIFGSAFVASAITLALFGPVWIVGFVLWIIVAAIAGRFLAPLAKPMVLAVTDRRLVLVNMTSSYLRFEPQAAGVEIEFPITDLPRIDLKQIVRNVTLTLEAKGAIRKIRIDPSSENIEAARRIASQSSGQTGAPS
jgi:hypothetical protein